MARKTRIDWSMIENFFKSLEDKRTSVALPFPSSVMNDELKNFCETNGLMDDAGNLIEENVKSFFEQSKRRSQRTNSATERKWVGYRDGFLEATKDLAPGNPAESEKMRKFFFDTIVAANKKSFLYVSESACHDNIHAANTKDINAYGPYPASIDEFRERLTIPGPFGAVPMSTIVVSAISAKDYADDVYRTVITNGVNVYTAEFDALVNSYAAFRQAHPGEVVPEMEAFFSGERGGLAVDPADSKKLIWVTKPAADGTRLPIGPDFRDRMKYVTEDPATVTQRQITRGDITKLKQAIALKEASYTAAPPVTPVPVTPTTPATPAGGEYVRKHGFFARIGRFILRHPKRTIIVATLATLTVLAFAAPVTLATYGLATIATTLGVPAGVSIASGIAHGLSPKYREFKYNYDIEKNFIKSFKQREEYEQQLVRLKEILGKDPTTGIPVIEQLNAKTDEAERDNAIRAILDADKNKKKNASKVAKTLLNLEQGNKDTVAEIRALTSKKRTNAKLMGMDEDARRAHVIDEASGADYEENKRRDAADDATRVTIERIRRVATERRERTK